MHFFWDLLTRKWKSTAHYCVVQIKMPNLLWNEMLLLQSEDLIRIIDHGLHIKWSISPLFLIEAIRICWVTVLLRSVIGNTVAASQQA